MSVDSLFVVVIIITDFILQFIDRPHWFKDIA